MPSTALCPVLVGDLNASAATVDTTSEAAPRIILPAVIVEAAFKILTTKIRARLINISNAKNIFGC